MSWYPYSQVASTAMQKAALAYCEIDLSKSARHRHVGFFLWCCDLRFDGVVVFVVVINRVVEEASRTKTQGKTQRESGRT